MAKKDFNKGLNEILLADTTKENKKQEEKKEFVHSSFVIEKSLHKKIRKYALDNDMKIQDAITMAIEYFFTNNRK
jgi:hypothetical protein